MAHDERLMPSSPSPAPEVRFMMASSSASTPSLRSRDAAVMPVISRMDRGGNVKVVVRVRAFLQRGRLRYYRVFNEKGSQEVKRDEREAN